MDLQPTLQGPTVWLRPILPEDFEALHAVASDPQLWAQHPARERWRKLEFRSYFDTWFLRGGGLAIVELANGQIIGASCYSVEGRPAGEVEIGWTFLARSHWGGRTNREVKWLMIRHALESFERVVFRVAETNLRSRGALVKIGAVLTDRAETIEINGRAVNHFVYSIGRDAPIAGGLL